MADRYWVGGTATWDGTAGTKWATTSGGAGGAAVPTSSDDVYFDAASGAVTVTTSGTTTDVCKNLNFTGFTGTFSHTNATTVGIYGSLTLGSGMTYTVANALTSILDFLASTTGHTLTFNGKTTGFPRFGGNSGVTGGGWTMQDDWPSRSGGIQHTGGHLNTNGYSITITGSGGNFNSTGSAVRELTFGASSHVFGGNQAINFTGSNLTFNAGTSLISASTCSTFNGLGFTFYDVTITSTTLTTMTGANTFHNLTRTNTSSNSSAGFSLGSDIVVTGTLTMTSSSALGRQIIRSATPGTPITVTAAAVSMNRLDFCDITAAGAANWDLSAITDGSGDCGGNSGITFTAPVTSYWVPSGGTSTGGMSAATRWASSSGGTAGTGRSPLPQDTAIFDANSIDAGSRTITQDKPRLGNTDFSAVTNTPAFSKNVACSVFGDFILGTMTQSGSPLYTFEGRGENVLKSPSVFTNSMTIDAVTGTYRLTENFSTSNTTAPIFKSGTFDANGYSFDSTGNGIVMTNATTILYGGSCAGNVTKNSGSGTGNINGDFSVTGNLTLTAGTLNVRGALTATGSLSLSSTLNMIGGSVVWSSGAINGSGLKTGPGMSGGMRG